MALTVKDRIRTTTTTTGTGTFTVSTTAATGYLAFNSITDADTTYYCCALGSEWEVGIGTVGASGTTLARTTILASSNAGAAVNFSAGTKIVTCVYPAGKSVHLDASGNYTFPGTLSSTGTLSPLGLVDASGASAGQIKFPAAQNASANANTLDDYEEGTFTPTMSFATPGTSSWAYTTQTGTYTKIGDLAFISIDLNATPTIGTGSGTISINALPFTAAASPASQQLIVGSMGSVWTWPASRTQVHAILNASTTSMQIRATGSGQTNVDFAATNMTGGSAHVIRISGCYKVT
jgi:hypothetical protein